jgi:hypothetical protein
MKVATSDARRKSRIAFLDEDFRSDRTAEAQYRFRQQRLKAIREELAQLRLPS